VMVTS